MYRISIFLIQQLYVQQLLATDMGLLLLNFTFTKITLAEISAKVFVSPYFGRVEYGNGVEIIFL